MSDKTQSIAKSATLVTIMMLSFKILGFLKQAVIAYFYGATLQTDAYFIAWGFISGVSEAIIKALSVSIVAIYTSLRIQKGKKEANKLINGLIEILVPVFCFLMFVIIISSPLFSHILAPSYKSAESHALTVYIIVLAPVMIFSSIELVFGAVLDSHKSFLVPRLQSLIYSLSTIIACILFSSFLGVKALILSQYVSYILFTLLVVFAARKYHSFAVVKIKDIPELRNIIKTAVPLFIGNSALQINQIVDKSITSGIGDGAASSLAYCHTLEQFVTNIMIVNIGNVMFANFAEFVAQGDISRIKDTLSKSIDLLITVLFAVSIITIICSKDIVSIVYYRGNFNYDALVMTATALMGYAFSFVAVAIRDLSVKSLYAFKDTSHPMCSSIISIVINICFSVILSKYIGILGVSLATSISAVVGMILNARYLVKYIEDYKYSRHLITIVKCIPGGSALILLCCFIIKILKFNSILTFVLSSSVGLALYFSILYILKVESVTMIYGVLKNYMLKKLRK